MRVVEYIPKGVCSKKITITLDNNIIKDIKILGGCPGNSLGLIELCKDQNIDDIINKLEGIKCGFKNTSCPDQLASALKNSKKEN